MDLNMEDKKLEVLFSPGCFDNFDGTQEELDAFVAEIHKLVESGEFFKDAEVLDIEDLGEVDEQEFEDFISQPLENNTRILH